MAIMIMLYYSTMILIVHVTQAQEQSEGTNRDDRV